MSLYPSNNWHLSVSTSYYKLIKITNCTGLFYFANNYYAPYCHNNVGVHYCLNSILFLHFYIILCNFLLYFNYVLIIVRFLFFL